MSITVEVPDEIAQAIQLPEGERQQRLTLELACSLYAQALLPCGKAAELAGMSRDRFGEELGKREIPRHYTAQELAEDVKYGLGE